MGCQCHSTHLSLPLTHNRHERLTRVAVHHLHTPLSFVSRNTRQEYMPGGTLKQLITREMLGNGRRTYTNEQALDICLQMARGLR